MDNKNSSLTKDSYCHRCSLKPIELICYECNPSNSFCRNCDATTHSLPSKKNHKRDIVNFMFQNEQQKLEKEIMKMKQTNKASLDIITTPIKENIINYNDYNKFANRSNIINNNDISNNECNYIKSFDNTSKTIEILGQDRRKFVYEKNYKIKKDDKNKDLHNNDVDYQNNKALYQDQCINEYNYEKFNKNNQYKNNNNFSKTFTSKNNGKENDENNYAKTFKTGIDSLKDTNENKFFNTKSSNNNYYDNNYNNLYGNKDKKITISCYDPPITNENNQSNNLNNYNNSNDNNNFNETNIHNPNQYNQKQNYNTYDLIDNNKSNLNLNNENNNHLSANGNNAYSAFSSSLANNYNSNKNSDFNQNNKNLNLQNFNSTANSNLNANDLKSTNFITASSASYYSKEFVNELTTLHNKEKEDFLFKMNIMQNSIDRIKLSLSEQMQNIQKQLEENNVNYSNKIKNLEQQQKKLSEKNIWLNDQDKQKDKIIESLKAQMKKLKDSNAELLEKYEYHLDACKYDRVNQQKQFDELQTKIAQKEIEIEELKNYYNKKIEELVYLNTQAEHNVNRKVNDAGCYIGNDGSGENNINTAQLSESKIIFC